MNDTIFADIGIREIDFAFLINAFKRLPEIEKVILFGSRAEGRYRRGSDIDLAIIGDSANGNTTARLSYYLDDFPALLKFDILILNDKLNEELKKRIQQYGIVLYEKM